MTTVKRRERKHRPRRDWGRAVAVVLSVVFAVIGAVPLALGALVRTEVVRSWAARETSALIARELAVAARYEVRVQAWPMLVALENVVVDASDGGAPFLSVERIAVRPRLFSLLGGHLDAGDVEIVGPRIRAVVAGGELTNLRYTAPAAKPESGGSDSPPLSSFSITDAHVDADVEGVRVAVHELDVDVSAEQDAAFEIALRAGETAVTRLHPVPGREATEDAVDEDVICRLDARLRFQGRKLLVRRLLLAGSLDFDPDPGTRPSCSLSPSDWRNVEVRLGALRVELPRPAKDGAPAAPLAAGGRVHARLPAAIVHRFVDAPHLTGSVTLDLEGEYDGRSRLPMITGHIVADRPGAAGKIFGAPLTLDVATTADKVTVTRLVTVWGDGRLFIPEVTIEPFAPGIPLVSGPITVDGVELHSLLRDLGAHPRSHVAWTLERGRFEYFKGTLDPPVLEGPLVVQTRGFEVFDKPVIDPSHNRMIGVREATVRCTFGIDTRSHAPNYLPGVVISRATIDTPRSHMMAAVTLGFEDGITIDAYEGSHVDLAEIGPIGDIPISGIAHLKVSGRGKTMDHPKLGGELRLSEFAFAGFNVGEVESPRIAFEPLVLDLFEAKIRHNKSLVRAGQVRLDFDGANGSTVIADADVDTTEVGLGVRDLFEVFHFDKDPRFTDLDALASGKARVHYALGGREDRCGGGLLKVRAQMDLSRASLFGESFDRGSLDADLTWDDQAAGSAGMTLDLYSATLQKGDGSVLVGATVRHGGVLRGNVVASGIPLGRLDALGASGKLFEGTASMVAELGGTLGALTAAADVNVSRLRVGPSTLGPSHLGVALTIDPPPPPPPGARPRGPQLTACKNPRAQPYDQQAYDRDDRDGDVVIDGSLFDGQISLQKLRVSRQRHKVARGTVTAKGLDLGTLANLIPGVAYGGAPPRGALSATLDLKALPFDAPSRAEVGLTLDTLDLERAGARLRLLAKTGRIELGGDELRVPDLKVEVRSGSGVGATVVAGGTVHKATTVPDVDLAVRVEPMDLGRLSADLPSVDRAGGTLTAALRIQGPPASLRYAGAASLRKGELALKGTPIALSEVDVDVEIGGGEARLQRAVMRLGGGTVKAKGRLPLRGPEAGSFLASIDARGVKLPVAEGINLTADAHLEASYRPGAPGGPRALPDVKGTVELTQFSYTRPISLNLSLSQFGRAPRTAVTTYDPESDLVRFNVNLVSPKPLRFANDLVEMDLEVLNPGLVLSGTNQRFGARGLLRILPDSKIQIRGNDFLVREGFVRFDDPLKISPKVDVRATTEYRRYASGTGPETPGAASVVPTDTTGGGGVASLSPASSTNAAGLWRIKLQARGEADNLSVTLSSDPTLSQEDIVLLLTWGMTRAEMDRGAASALGESVGLEALSALTGADKAVKKIVPLIDEFRFGTGYSTRTARTEPTVTVGKRVTDSVRTSVTTGVSEDREVRSNIEWRLNRQMSVQGSYDNLNDISSSPVGNIGIDFRWRLEFE
jgi:translocation and assembly module TamB